MIDLSQAPDLFYAVYTKAGKEREAAFNLEKQGASVFAPFCKNTRYFTRNLNYRTLPAFPRYIFAASHSEAFQSKIRNTRGVSDLVWLGEGPARVEKSVLQVVIDYSTDDLVDFSYFDTSPAFRYAIGEILKVTFGEWFDGVVRVAGQDQSTGEYIVEPYVDTDPALSTDRFNPLDLAGLLKMRKSERHLTRM